MNEFYVYGSHGELTVDADTGDVIELMDQTYDSEEYRDIVRFDVHEWRREYPTEAIEGTGMDILDIGFWTDTGEYIGPEQSWRDDRKREEIENERLNRAVG